MIEVRAFKTQDGQYFSSKEKAEAHELKTLFSRIAKPDSELTDGRFQFCTYSKGDPRLLPVEMMKRTIEYADDLRKLHEAASIKFKFSHRNTPVELDALIYAAENSAHFDKVLAYLETGDVNLSQDAVVQSIR